MFARQGRTQFYQIQNQIYNLIDMKKRVLFFACISMLFSLGTSAQTAQLYRQASDATASVASFTYTTSTGGDVITYPSSLSTSTSNICAPSVRRVQLASFTLNYKTSSIGKIVISANSSGSSSSRTLTTLKVGGADVTSSVTITSNVIGNSGGAGFSDCGDITITGLSVPADPTNGVNLEFTFDNNIRLNTISVWSIQALPLDFVSFSAKPDAMGKSVNLTWKTSNEVNTQDFVVERKSDKTEFSPVGTVLSKNTAGTHSYSFIDTKPLPGTSFYRLKQRDKDGKYNTSEVVDVKINSLGLSIFPNPVSKELVVSHEYVKQAGTFKVVGLDGKNLIKTNTSIGSSSTTINVAALPSGTYVLVYEGEGKPQSQKFIKK